MAYSIMNDPGLALLICRISINALCRTYLHLMCVLSTVTTTEIYSLLLKNSDFEKEARNEETYQKYVTCI
jgi:hypothetical protein